MHMQARTYGVCLIASFLNTLVLIIVPATNAVLFIHSSLANP